jgi:DNA-binding MarR family transcriptional regulator
MRRIIRSVETAMVDVVAAQGYQGVRPQHLRLFAHVPRDEGIRMSALADQMQLTAGAVTQLVDQLQRMGLVERVADASDRRATRVRPTPAAEAGYEAGRRFIAEREAAWSRLVGPRRWATFRDVLEQIAAHEDASATPRTPSPRTNAAAAPYPQR